MATIAPDPWGVAQADVRVTCPLTIGGSFDANTVDVSGSVTASTRGTPSFDGTLAVDLRTLDTGIGLRNEHLRDRHLEVGKGAAFTAATLTGLGIVGLDPETPEGKGAFTASLTLHGVAKAVTGSVDVRRAHARSLKVKALFPVALADYGIPVPRFLGVGVEDTVHVQVSFTAAHRAGR